MEISRGILPKHPNEEEVTIKNEARVPRNHERNGLEKQRIKCRLENILTTKLKNKLKCFK